MLEALVVQILDGPGRFEFHSLQSAAADLAGQVEKTAHVDEHNLVVFVELVEWRRLVLNISARDCDVLRVLRLHWRRVGQRDAFFVPVSFALYRCLSCLYMNSFELFVRENSKRESRIATKFEQDDAKYLISRHQTIDVVITDQKDHKQADS